MIRNYIKSAIRDFTRNKFYSLLNILGLCIGLVSVIFILLYVNDELSYDKYHKKYKRIYRIESDFTVSGKHDMFAISSFPMGPALKNEYPEVESFVRIFNAGDLLVKYNEKDFYENNIYFADSTVFNVFSHNFIFGTPEKALTEPNTIVLTQKLKEKYFGDENPLGKILEDGDGDSFKVTGVIENLPENSHLKFEGLISMTTVGQFFGFERFNSFESRRFWNITPFVYILLNENSDMKGIYSKIPKFYEKYFAEVGTRLNGEFKMLSTRLDKIHLHSKLGHDLPTGNISNIYIFLLVGIFIIIIASINYMNIATARSEKRAKEVGIRKVIGAYKKQLIRQFISESIIFIFIALFLAFFVAWLLLPEFNYLAGKNFIVNQFFNLSILFPLLMLTILVGFLSGSYPAFYLSAFRPVEVLKGSLGNEKKGGGMLRKILVIFQFTIAIAMIIGTIIVYNQLNFLQNRDMGFDKENVIVTQLQDREFRNKIPVLKEELLQNPDIESITTSTSYPGQQGGIVVMRVENNEKMQEETVNYVFADYDYLNLLKLDLVKGRNFDKKMGTDLENAVIINEAAAKEFGWGNNAIGKKIDFGMREDGTFERSTKVIGVVKNYNYISLHNKIDPIVIFLRDSNNYNLLLRIKEGKTAKTIEFLREKWIQFSANRPFNYVFLDKNFERFYEGEKKLGSIFTIFSIISVLVSLLGLLGLSSYTTEQKTKEIGIRKVLGASTKSILSMLLKKFSYLILIGYLIAIPISYYLLNTWLQKFAYHVNINIGVFVLAGILAFFIAFISVSFFAVKAAVNNPIDALKYE